MTNARHNRGLQTMATALLLMVVASLSGGCGRRLEAPPLEVLQRPSLVGAGMIVQLKSTTNEELTEVEVTIASANRELTHVEAWLGAYETVEIGWKKLGGWQIPEDAKVEVRAAGYLLPVRARLVPDREASSEAGSGDS